MIIADFFRFTTTTSIKLLLKKLEREKLESTEYLGFIKQI